MTRRLALWLVVAGGVATWCSAPARAEVYYRIDQSGIAHFTNVPTAPGYRLLQPGMLGAASRLVGASLNQLIEAFAAVHDLDAALIRAVIQAESNFNPRAISRKGAQGLMQLMPSTIWRLSVGDAFDPYENIGAGVQYLRQLLDLFRGDLRLALAAYNAGAQAVLRYQGVPPYPETREYVRKVLSLYRQAQQNAPRGQVAKAGAAGSPPSPQAAPPPPPPPMIYKAEEASGVVFYSNIPPVIRAAQVSN